MTRLSILAMTFGVLPLAGCYQGLGDNASAPAAEGNDDGVADGDDDNDDGEEDDGPVPPRAGDDDDGPVDDEAPFVLPTDEVELLPFPVRMTNLARLASVPTEHPMFFEAYDLRLLIGGHDYSVLEAPDLRWSAERMQNWVRALKPVCASNEMQIKYPDLVDNPTPLMREAFGRDPLPGDLEPMLDIANSTLTDDAKFQLACLAVLSSLEFVAY